MSDEWYTPADLLNECKQITMQTTGRQLHEDQYDQDSCPVYRHRQKLGLPKTAHICVDPITSGLDNSCVWVGNVFVNPPYSDIEPWIERQ